MIPRLVRFYGGDPMTWLDRTPLAVVTAHLDMLGRLSAEEDLASAQLSAAGRALKLGHWVSSHLSRLRRAALGLTRSASASPGDLSAAGIAVVEVRKKK